MTDAAPSSKPSPPDTPALPGPQGVPATATTRQARKPEDSPTLLLMSLLSRLGAIGWGLFNGFGFLWVGHPTPGIVAAWLAMLAACTPASRPGSGARRSLIIFLLSVCAIVLQVVDIVYYYRYQAMPGNYYPWVTTVFAFGIFALLAIVGWVTRALAQGASGSDKTDA